MSSETVRSMLRLRPPASAPRSPSAAQSGSALATSGRRGATAARARETKAGREPTFRGFGGPAPRPGLGKGRASRSGRNNAGGGPAPNRQP